MRKSKKILYSGLLCAILASGYYTNVLHAEDKVYDPLKSYQEISKTKKGILSYKASVNKKIQQIKQDTSKLLAKQDESVEDILVTVTFAKPLTEEQVFQLIDDHDLQTLKTNARLIAKDNNRRSTIFTPFDDKAEHLIEPNSLDNLMSNNNLKFEGFIELVANVSQENLEKLSKNDLVFLADPSADNSFANNPRNKPAAGLFWTLENNEMVEK